MLTSEAKEAFLSTLPPALTRRGADSATVKQVAEAIRRDLKLAAAAGLLPAGAKFSVKLRHHTAIDVDLVAWTGRVLRPSYEEALMQHLAAQVEAGRARDLNIPAAQWDADELRRQLWQVDRRHVEPRLSDEVNDAVNLAEAIADRHNYDDSDAMTDYFNVGYYLDVDARELLASAERGIQLAIDPALRDLVERATAAAARLGAKCVRSVCGAGGVDGASAWELNALLKIDARAAGRPVAYSKFRRAWLPTNETAVAG